MASGLALEQNLFPALPPGVEPLTTRNLQVMGFPGGSDGKESSCTAGDLGSTPGLGRSPGGRHGNPLLYSCLENPRGQRTLAGYIQSMGSQRVGHDWATKHSNVRQALKWLLGLSIPGSQGSRGPPKHSPTLICEEETLLRHSTLICQTLLSTS